MRLCIKQKKVVITLEEDYSPQNEARKMNKIDFTITGVKLFRD